MIFFTPRPPVCPGDALRCGGSHVNGDEGALGKHTSAIGIIEGVYTEVFALGIGQQSAEKLASPEDTRILRESSRDRPCFPTA